jgi:hypothetical protein
MTELPREAREGLMRAWLEVLRQRHPHVAWIPAEARNEQAAAKQIDTEALATSA